MRIILSLVAVVSVTVVGYMLFLSGLFLSPSRVVSAVVLPALIAMTSLALLRLPRAAQQVGVLYGLAALAAVLGFELSRELRHSPKWTPWDRTVDAPYPMICGKYVMVVEADGTLRSALRRDGEELQPLAGISRNPTGHTCGDEFGFSNPPGQWQPDAVRIMAVGDSFAAGADVAPGEGFVDLIRAGLGTTVNLGCSWNGPLLELASLVEYGPIVRPQTVVWFFFEGNDLTDLEQERRSPLLLKYLHRGFAQGLPQEQTVLDDLLRKHFDLRIKDPTRSDFGGARALDEFVQGGRHDRGINWQRVVSLRNTKWSMGILDYGGDRRVFGWLAEIMRRALDSVREWNGRMIFVYLPCEARFMSRVARIEAQAYRTRVLAAVTAPDLPVLDLTPVFENEPRPRSLFHGHYTPAGNRIVANTVVSMLKGRQ